MPEIFIRMQNQNKIEQKVFSEIFEFPAFP